MMLWAAHKVTIRGKLIQISSQIRQNNRAEIDRLERKFLRLSKEHKQNPKLIPTAKLDAAWTTVNLALTSRAEKSLR